MAQVIPFAEVPRTPPPEPGAFVETETARDILRSLELALATAGATMIAGRPGVGKTSALDRFHADRRGEVLRITATAGMASPWWMATELLKGWGVDPRRDGGGLETAFAQLARYVPANGYRMILVDEAQYLDQRSRRADQGAGFEWLRGLTEKAGIALALAGDLALSGGIERFPQLRSRMVRPVVIDRVTPRDVAGVAASYGVTGPIEMKALMAVARKAGALRNVGNVLKLASIFAGRASIGGEHIAAAILDLKLAPRGSQA